MTDHNPATVGVDISKAYLDVHELPSGRTARIANTAAGFNDLAAWIAPETRCVAYESTGRWHRAMEEALAAILPLACVNPARVRRFAQALGQEAKTDAVDARVLAMMAAAIKLRRVEQASPVQRDLEELNTARDALVRDRTATLNRSKHLRHKLLRRQNQLRLAQIERQIKALDTEIRRLVGDDDELSRKVQILASIPGVAQTTAVGLLAGMPELGRLGGRAAASLAGLAPFTRESGKWKGYSSSQPRQAGQSRCGSHHAQDAGARQRAHHGGSRLAASAAPGERSDGRGGHRHFGDRSGGSTVPPVMSGTQGGTKRNGPPCASPCCSRCSKIVISSVTDRHRPPKTEPLASRILH